jgi:ferredoxin
VKIHAHPGLCEGHGVCRRFAPSVYRLDGEGYLDLHRLDVPPELEAAAELGATVCPAHAITIVRDDPSPAGAAPRVDRRTEPTVLADQNP